jgi:tRNA threonylcarbamoyladenosine biosynthesis protein TsaE
MGFAPLPFPANSAPENNSSLRAGSSLAVPYRLTYNLCVPILDEHTFEFFSRSPEQTRRIGMRLGGVLEPGDLVCLQGELGAGKTTLVQGVAQGWGSLDPVSSPTFVLVNEYRRPDGSQLFHMDAYRLESGAEAAELDLDWMLAQGALVIEWPERVQGILPADALRVYLDAVAEEQRQMRFNARGTRYDHVLAQLQRTMFGVA